MALRGIEVSAFSETFPMHKTPFLEGTPIQMDLRLLYWMKTASALKRGLERSEQVLFHNFPSSVYVRSARALAKGAQSSFPRVHYYCHEPRRPLYGSNRDEFRAMNRRRLRRVDIPAWNNIRLDRLAVGEAHTAMANSQRTARYAQEVFHRPFQVVYPGLPPSFLAEPIVEKERDRFVYLGRLHPGKNVLGAIEAFSAYCRLTPGSRETLWVIGDGELKSACQALMHREKVEDRVHLAGFLPRAQIEEHLSHAHAVLNINLDEPFGLVTLECWARGTPVILARDGGSAEVAQDGEDALCVDGGNPESVAKAMVRLTEERRLASRMIEAGRRKLEGRFMIRHHVDALLSCMEAE